jgi:protein-S-isoprenylcysteine O-methyltransferase Ste14/SAM-dependent methyltransferase
VTRAKTEISREIGLELASLCGRYFLKSQHLHYGYWTGDFQIDVANLHIAQENYTDFLVSHIPDGVKKILDVGCGTGQIAAKLTGMGYQVDCVSPSPFLSTQARELLGSTSRIYECSYEDLQTETRYDLILFGESFQYIDPEQAIKKTLAFLNQGGYLLICDIFKKDAPGDSPLPGGHPLTVFYDLVSECPLESVKDLDITEQTAPTLDILNDALKQVVEPSLNLAKRLLNNRYPFMSKFINWLYRKKIKKINKKYFSGEKTGANFMKFKSYRLLLYRKAHMKEARRIDCRDVPAGTAKLKLHEESKVSAITKLAASRQLRPILKSLAKWRTAAMMSAFAIVLAENIINREKPYELFPPEVSIMAVCGLCFVIAGILLRCWAQGHFIKGRLSAAGPYAIVRHPLHLGSLLITTGVLFQLGDWLNWLLVLFVFAVFHGAAVICEEKSSEKRFGRQWRSYRAKTPAIIPSLPDWSSLAQTGKWSWKAYLTTRESRLTPVLLTLPLLIELMEDFLFEAILGM